MNGEQESRRRVDYRWIVVGIMVVVGSFLLALYDRYDASGNEEDGYRTIGWLLVLGSSVIVRHLGKQLLVFFIAVYVAATMLNMSFTPLTYRWVHRSELADCRGWDDYVDDLTAQGEAFNARMAGVSDVRDLSPRELNTLIAGAENDMEHLSSLDAPKALQAAHTQHIHVLRGWLTVYEAIRDGSYSNQMIFDLQAEDDEGERLIRNANDRCAA